MKAQRSCAELRENAAAKRHFPNASKDIADYNREIGHKFNAMESAFLVWQSLQHTMDERFAAWEEIIDTMPDMVMEERRNMERSESVHGFLQSYISLMKRVIEEFYDDSRPAVWSYGTQYQKKSAGEAPECIKDGCLYSSYDDCYESAVRSERESGSFDEVLKFRIITHLISRIPVQKHRETGIYFLIT